MNSLLSLVFILAACCPSKHEVISKHVVKHGMSTEFQGAGGGGTSYKMTIYDSDFTFCFYDVSVYHYKDGTKSMTISAYVTNVNFAEIKTPADAIAHELRMGKPRMFQQYHMSDSGIDGKVDMVQKFWVKGNGIGGFTRRDRDRMYSEVDKKKITETIWDGGQVWEAGGKWRKAENRENTDAYMLYQRALDLIHQEITKSKK